MLAFGRTAYYQAACNLAASLRAVSPDVHLTVHVESTAHLPPTHSHLFTKVKVIPAEIIGGGVMYGAGYVKARIYDLLPKGAHLVIDADSLVLKDITPLLEEIAASPKYFMCECFGSTTTGDGLPYFPWATPDQVRDKVGGEHDHPIHDVQTSWMFLRKPEAAAFADAVFAAFGLWDREETIGKWGHGIPDELAYTTAIAATGIDPTGPKGAMFFGSVYYDSTAKLKADYYTLTLYGQGAGKTHTKRQYFEWYDRLLYGIYTAMGMGHLFKAAGIMASKYVNTTKR